MNYLSISLAESENMESALTWMRTRDVPSILTSYVENLRATVSSVERGAAPAAILGGNYQYIVFAHLGSLMGELEHEAFLSSIAADERVLSASTPFWREYALTLSCLREGRAHDVKLEGLNALESSLATYIPLMQDGQAGRDMTSSLTEIDRAFRDRNQDPSVSDDSYEIEGSGSQSVKVDFRKAALLILIGRLQSTR
ncbi:hypothetical protein [Marilutibacter alkalisoli]|uniref:Uncharacterized protein n=1 Tax=Marilutibacter alkalisoli TaxID=2591633 RepID=A0A514BS10_9GAMM|nr:hypothetical protein [Lysobacter alkalisoli]QDH70171.1 hypothetical protein FKV23_08725 [Lysobacter alkalisoli]